MFKDVRDYQILFLASFLFLGISTKDWTLKPELIIVLLLTCLISQWFNEELKTYLSTKTLSLSNPLKLGNKLG
jgi:Na+-transporting NADH:ubiquinone oxidoreductase subunit NqrB